MVDERRSWFDGAAVLGLCLEVPVETVLAAARHGRDAGASVIVNLSPYTPVPAELLALTDLLLVNEHELAQLLDGTDRSWAERARALAERGIGRAVVTLGSEGSVVLDPAGRRARGHPDPGGAGDAGRHHRLRRRLHRRGGRRAGPRTCR